MQEVSIYDAFYIAWYLKRTDDDEVLLAAVLVFGLYAHHCSARLMPRQYDTHTTIRSVHKLAGLASDGRLGKVWREFVLKEGCCPSRSP